MNIRKFFKVRNYYLLLGVIMINVGCTKNFLEYNTNPNEATDEMTDWDNVKLVLFFYRWSRTYWW